MVGNCSAVAGVARRTVEGGSGVGMFGIVGVIGIIGVVGGMVFGYRVACRRHRHAGVFFSEGFVNRNGMVVSLQRDLMSSAHPEGPV